MLALLGARPALVQATAGDDAAWRRLTHGGHVLLLRHALTDPGIGDPPGFVLGKCGTQRNLSPTGRRHASEIGAAFRTRSIPVGPVWSSRWCRCLETARLAFGRAQPMPMLDSMFQEDEASGAAKVAQVKARVAASKESANLVLVTHGANILALTGESVSPGEMVLVKAGDPELRVLGRLIAYSAGA
jgi:broad specificity phosphatase PhoE